ncbi:MAG: hypothetical protein V2J26_06165 [Pacificimonas sp.]|jgi:hypothetical protein|nr:hypothetical protein [Pacificimonas sp.]
MSVLVQIEKVMRRTGVSASRLGREATGDPRLVFDLRKGRQMRPDTERRLSKYLAGRLGDTL